MVRVMILYVAIIEITLYDIRPSIRSHPQPAKVYPVVGILIIRHRVD
jgi:hypothetical protein